MNVNKMKAKRVRGNTAPCIPDQNNVTFTMLLTKVTQIYGKTVAIETHSVTEAKYNCAKHFLLTEQLTKGSYSLS